MEHHSRAHLRITLSYVAALTLSSLPSGCSSDGGPPSPARAEAASGKQGAPAKSGEAKARKLRPGQQDPGTANYEDKPGGRTRGR
jgi:hypothetical protein